MLTGDRSWWTTAANREYKQHDMSWHWNKGWFEDRRSKAYFNKISSITTQQAQLRERERETAMLSQQTLGGNESIFLSVTLYSVWSSSCFSTLDSFKWFQVNVQNIREWDQYVAPLWQPSCHHSCTDGTQLASSRAEWLGSFGDFTQKHNYQSWESIYINVLEN